MINKKIVYGIDFILIFGSLVTLFFLIGYLEPRVISPINGFESSSSSVLFSFEKANLVLIDDNLDFSSPNKYYVKDNLIINLKPGFYYWKVVGLSSSEVRHFTIESNVSLKIRKSGESYDVINGGNTKLDVDVYLNGTLNDSLILNVNEFKKAKGDKFIGGQDE